MDHQTFFDLIRMSVSKARKINPTQGSENNPLWFGGVEFWMDGETVCYDIPAFRWDTAKVSEDLTAFLENKS